MIDRPGWVASHHFQPCPCSGDEGNFRCVGARRRQRYDDARAAIAGSALADWLDIAVTEEILDDFGVDLFGMDTDAVDVLFLAAEAARAFTFVLAEQVEHCRYEGFTWDEIADALGVSRQAATRRFVRGPINRSAPLRPVASGRTHKERKS